MNSKGNSCVNLMHLKGHILKASSAVCATKRQLDDDCEVYQWAILVMSSCRLGHQEVVWLEEGCAFEGYILSQPCSGSLSASTLRTPAFLPQAHKQEPADPGVSEAGSQRRLLPRQTSHTSSHSDGKLMLQASFRK